MKIAENNVTKHLPINVKIAEHQDEYQTVPSNIGRGVIAYAFDLDRKDIRKLKKHKRIYLLQINGKSPMQPMNISVDPAEFDDMIIRTRLGV